MPDAPATNNHHHHHASSSSSVTGKAISIDGCEEDKSLARSAYLTRQEVVRRRSRRVKQLGRIYRKHYWDFMEELRIKHREYIWDYGTSPFQEDAAEENNHNNNQINSQNNNGNHENESNIKDFVAENGRCGVQGCKTKAMPLTRFCPMHILSDPKQKLFKACNYAIKSSPTGPILCGKPILRNFVPSYCFLHLQKADKHITRALKKAGLNVSSTSKVVPKFHVLIGEYVNQIQSNRRAALKASLESADVKEEFSI